MLRTIVALARSTHPVPSLAVTGIVVILGVGVGLEPSQLALLGAAVLANQFSVGLSNDWLDADRDRTVGRRDKPVAQGLVSTGLARNTAFVLAAASIVLSLGLGWLTAAALSLFLVAGWSYNLWLKSTVYSVAPYIVGFGALPLTVTLALPTPEVASVWAVLAAALLGVAAHFANVLPDLEDDAATGVYGLPHRVGRRVTGVIIAVALVGASTSIVCGLGPLMPALIAVAVVGAILAIVIAGLVVTNKLPRAAFALILLVALVDVVLIAVSGAGVRG
jgi:4-hydroxybenzoate polyprenyltransferase